MVHQLQLFMRGKIISYVCKNAFLGVIFLRENVNLMYFVRDVVIESLVVIHYSLFLYVKP